MRRRACLGQAERPHVAQQRVGRGAGAVGHAPAFLGPPQIVQGVRHPVGDFDLGLVGGDLVDDVAVGRRERAERPVAPLEGVGRVAVLDRGLAQPEVGADQVLLGRADLGRDRRDEAVAEVAALEQERDLLVDRVVERSDRVDARAGRCRRRARSAAPSRRSRAAECSRRRSLDARQLARAFDDLDRALAEPSRRTHSGWARRRWRRRRSCR